LSETVGLITSETDSGCGIPSSALITDGDADILLIEEESDRAQKTVSISIPLLTFRISLISKSSDGAATIGQAVALVTLLADTNILIEQPALRMNLAAGSVYVKVVSN